LTVAPHCQAVLWEAFKDRAVANQAKRGQFPPVRLLRLETIRAHDYRFVKQIDSEEV
jgi:hypothetical protein